MENSYNALLVALDSNQDEELLPPEGYIPAGPITPEGRISHGLWYPLFVALVEMSVNIAQLPLQIVVATLQLVRPLMHASAVDRTMIVANLKLCIHNMPSKETKIG